MSQERSSGKEQAMLSRVFGSTLALLSFSVVCMRGLLQGESFGPVIRHSLIALAAGGAAGVLAAMAVRYVVREEFVRRRDGADGAGAGQPPAGAAAQDGSAGKEAAEGRTERSSQTPAGSKN